MTGARFARTSRCRFFAGICALIVMIGMVAIFHSSQEELDDVRHSVLQCEQNMEALKKRWQITMEQKSEIEKTHKEEKSEYLTSKHILEVRLKEQNDQHAKEQMESRVNLEKLQQTHKLLQHEHELLVNECAKSKKQQLDDANSLEKKLQSLRSELQKAKSLQESEVALWKEKYNAASKENTRLETLLNIADSEGEGQTQSHIKQLQNALMEYAANCAYKLKSLGADIIQQQINKPLNPPETTVNAKSAPALDRPQSQKFFKEQESVSPGLYHIAIKMVNRTENANNSMPSKDALPPPSSSSYFSNKTGDGSVMKIQHPFSAQNNRSLIINSVENFQIVPKQLQKQFNELQETQLKPEHEERKVAPLSAPRKLTSSHQSIKDEENRSLAEAESHRNATVVTSSSSNQPPLQMPSNQKRQLPAMVAPVPHFEELLKNDKEHYQRTSDLKKSFSGGDGVADIDAALEDMQQRQENDDGTNNRYANVVNDMEAKLSQKKSLKNVETNNDSGAHEIKDQDLANEPNFNLPAEDDENNFFDAGDKQHANLENDKKHKAGLENDDDDLGLGAIGGGGGAGAGDIAVKNHQHLLEGDSLNNEVAGDQGKEFPDGLRIEDANEEDEDVDEDDYANLAARHQGAQAIRN